MLLGWQAGSASADIRLEIDRISGGDWQVLGLRVDAVESVDRVEYVIAAEQLTLMGRTFAGIAWNCALPLPVPSTQEAPAEARSCTGPLRAGRRTIGALTWSPQSPREIGWRDRQAHVQAAVDDDGWRVAFSGVPVGEWLSALQPPDFPMAWRGGSLRGTVASRGGSGSLQADLDVQDLAFDGMNGTVAAEELGGSIRADMTSGAGGGWTLVSRTTLRAGLWLVGPALLQPPPDTEVQVDLRAGAEGVAEGRLRADDHDAAALDISFHREAGQGIEDSAWQLDAESGDLGSAWSRYLQGVVDWFGMPGLSAMGQVHARAAGRGDRIERVDLTASEFSVDGASGAMRTEPGSLALHWARVGSAEPSRWQFPGGRWRGAEIGPVDLAWSSTDGRIDFTQPASTTLFGGRLEIPSLRWSPFDGTLSLSAKIADVQLAPLTTWLDWPRLEGKLSGNLPAAHYQDETLSFDGGLSAGLLGGEARVDALRWERPFGVAPSLSADVRFQDLDLEPLTSTFGFGAITGRLDGEILGLRLLDGSPVQFSASLRTDPDWKGKQRISQRAVNDLSSIGGGGAVAGLQATVLKVFEEFSYRQIAISCRLERGVCHMGGIDSRTGGYTLVEGSGLPRITVNGFQKQVDWSVLVARLKAATSDGGVRVE